MYFSFVNAPATFQSIMNHIFKDLILKGQVMVYLDDILIFGNNKEKHKTIVLEVLSRLLNNNLFAKTKKCFFLRKFIDYLEMVISKGHININKKKVSEVLKWLMPTKVKYMQAFLGFANFYCRFIQDFARIVMPLMILTKKDIL